jgi:hypothetical protein
MAKSFLKRREDKIPKEPPSMVDILIDLNRRKDEMENALKAIFMNTIHMEDCIYKSGVLGNIEMAIGREEYKRWEDLYS